MIPKRTRLQRFNKYVFRKKLRYYDYQVRSSHPILYNEGAERTYAWQKRVINSICHQNGGEAGNYTFYLLFNTFLDNPNPKIRKLAFRVLQKVAPNSEGKEEYSLENLFSMLPSHSPTLHTPEAELIFSSIVPRYITEVDPNLQVYGLVRLITDYNEPDLKKLALEKLKELNEANALGRLALEWNDTRSEELAQLLPRWRWTKKLVPNPFYLKFRVMACLKTGFVEDIGELNHLKVNFLELACCDTDLQITERAAALLSSQPLTMDWIERVGRQWAANKNNLTKVLATLPYWQPPDALEAQSENSQSSFEEDEEESYTPLEWRWDWRVRLALKTGQLDWLTEPTAPVETVPLLVEEAVQDDADITANAWRVLATLNNPLGQDALCQMVITGQLPATLVPIVVQADYAPGERHQRVLFYFLTEQWDKYEELDWDHRILQLAYQTGSVTLQRRLAQRIRNSGRVDYLQILASSRRQAAEVDPENQGGIVPQIEEAGMVVQVLEKNGEWEQMWRLVRQLPLARSVYAVRKLAEQGWQPALGDGQALFAELDRLSQQPLITSLAKLKRIVAANRFEGLAEPIKQLFSQPLAQAQPRHLNSLVELRESGQLWAGPVQASLDYLEGLLRWRLRFAVEVSEETSLPAEFDIEIGQA